MKIVQNLIKKLNPTATSAALAAAIVWSVFAWWVNGLSIYSILLIVAFVVFTYLRTAANLQGKAPGTRTLNIGTMGWAVSILIAIALIIAAFAGRWTAAHTQGVILPPNTLNESMQRFADKIRRVPGLSPEQRQEVASLVPPSLSLSASPVECQAAKLGLEQAERRLLELDQENKLAASLAFASLASKPGRYVNWEELFTAEVRRNTLLVDKQLRIASRGTLKYEVKEIGTAASLNINPADHPGPWYVGLPRSGITGEDRGMKGLQGNFKSSAKTFSGNKHHFEAAGAHNAPEKEWWPLKNDQLCYTDTDRVHHGLFVRWKKGEKVLDETFTVSANYMPNEWPASWQVRISNIPREELIRITDVPTTLVGLPGERVDSLVNILITGEDGRIIRVNAEVWFGTTSVLVRGPYTSLKTTGEDNPALAIEHFCAEPVNVDITFLPRTKSEL